MHYLIAKKLPFGAAKRAVEILPISSDAMDGPGLLSNLAVVYAWSSELDKAFETIAALMKTPNGISYGDLKLSVWWDPLRKDPAFWEIINRVRAARLTVRARPNCLVFRKPKW